MVSVYSKVIVFATLTVVSNLIYKYFSNKKKNHEIKEVHDVIIFTYNDTGYLKSKYSRCLITHSMEKLLNYLKNTKCSLDICIYVFSNLDIANVVFKLHLQGVRVRIIVDADMAYSNGSTIKRMEKLGIPVRWMKSTNLMHHKFCLLDTAETNIPSIPVVITGSLNWTNQALYGNWENVVVTSQPEIVSLYKAEYEKMWKLFKPIGMA